MNRALLPMCALGIACGAATREDARPARNEVSEPSRLETPADPAKNHLCSASDADVYTAALNSVGALEFSPGILRIQRETEPPGSPLGEGDPAARLATVHRRYLPALRRETEHSFWKENRERDTLPTGLRLKRRYRMLDRPKTEVAEQSPPLFQVSRPGYSRDGCQALIYLGVLCGLCGKGEYLLLGNSDGQWQVIARSLDWIS